MKDQLLLEQRFDVLDLRTESGGFPLLIVGGRQFTADLTYSIDAFPLELRTSVAQGGSSQQRFEYRGEPYVAVGVAMPAVDAQYLEAFPMEGTQSTLRAIATALLVGSAVTMVLAGLLGWWTRTKRSCASQGRNSVSSKARTG